MGEYADLAIRGESAAFPMSYTYLSGFFFWWQNSVTENHMKRFNPDGLSNFMVPQHVRTEIIHKQLNLRASH